MIKKLLSLSAMAVLFAASTVAQSNTKFETWGPNATSNNNPTGWETLNVDKFGGPAGVTKETGNPGEGAISARLETKTGYTAILGQDTAGGMLFLNGNLMGGNLTGGIAYAGKPASFSALVKAAPMAGDTGILVAQLSHWDVNSQTQVVDAQAAMVVSTAIAAWTPGVVNFNYFTSDTPDTLQFFVSSSIGALIGTSLPKPGSVLWVDDIVFNFPVGINTNNSFERITAFPNPASSLIKIALGSTQASDIRISDITGKVIATETVNSNVVNVDVRNYPTGLYIYQVINNGKVVHTEKFNVIK